MFLALGMAGCVGGSPGQPELASPSGDSHVVAPPGAPKGLAPELGSIEGTVFSDELLPIQGANVSIVQPFVLSTTTDAEGRFGFIKLEPGSYAVVAIATGFESQARLVSVTTAAVTEAGFSLKPIAMDVPYESLFIDDFFFSCAVVAGPVGLNACGLVNATYPVFTDDRQLAVHESGPNLAAVVATLVWTTNQFLGARSMELSIYTDPDADEGFQTYTKGPSPLTNTTILETPLVLPNRVTTGTFPHRFCGPSNPPDCASAPPQSVAQAVFQQRAQGYTTQFYSGLPPAGYTGLPDG